MCAKPNPPRHPRVVLSLGGQDYLWLGNIINPKKKKVELEVAKIYKQTAANPNIVMGEPVATQTYTVEQLKEMGMEGIYERIKESPAAKANEDINEPKV